MKVAELPAQGGRTASAMIDRQQQIRTASERIKRNVQVRQTASVKTFQHIPYMSMEVDEAALQKLQADADVSGVYIDSVKQTSLQHSTGIVGAKTSCNNAYCGQGQTIAILDTGIDSTHPFLSGKVTHQACFSTSDPAFSVSSVCPNGQQSQIGGNAGAACSIDGCDHGTHVAGIAAGSGTNAGKSFSGVAPQADLMSVQVFSRFQGADCTDWGYSSPCVLAYTSDVIAGLEHVYSQRNSYAIASVNLSLGGGAYATACDAEPERVAIDLLTSAGIAVVAASGNEFSTSTISSPACISNAISVGATTDADAVASFSNSANFLDLLAPGSGIYSSVPGNSYANESGTSMAAPHVAAAFAVYRSFNPGASLGQIIAEFKNYGAPVLDSRNGLTTPRIDIEVLFDTDRDGLRDFEDPDDDNDGVLDVDDPFPFDLTESLDTDGDGIGNNTDTDDDNDRVLDVDDLFPLDPTESIDTDGDGIGNNADTDDDNDGVPDINDALPLDPTEWIDTDGDKIGDNTDTDDDNDGIADVSDNCPLDADVANINTDGDARCDTDDNDDDNDGLPDVYESLYAFLDPLNAADALFDEDADAYDNLSEYHALSGPDKASEKPTGSPFYKIIAADGTNEEEFGRSLAVDGDTALVGISQDDAKGTESGSAYVFKRDGAGKWVQEAKLTAADGTYYDLFGHSVAIDGDTALVGMPGDDDNGGASGSAYIFKRDGAGNWTQQTKLIAVDGEREDYFGSSVSLSGDTALVGAYADDDKAYQSGAAYVFKNDGAGNWFQQAKLTASDGEAGDRFAYSISLSGDTALVGSYEDDDKGYQSGSAYVFKNDGAGNWIQQAKLTALDGEAGDHFAYSVSLAGDTALVGSYEDDDKGYQSGSAYVFKNDGTGNWTQQAKLIAADGATHHYFGGSVAIEATLALVGAYGADGKGNASGAVYFFQDDGSGSWSQQTRLIATDGATGDAFGANVSLSAGIALAGAYRDDDNGSNSGSAYLVSLTSDGDGDGVSDVTDNCPAAVNPEQFDADQDLQGDTCDNDDDNDGYSDSDENDNGSSPRDANDTPPDNDGDFISDLNDSDDDGDGVLDSSDDCPFDSRAASINTDGDAMCDINDPDDDNDGLPDVYENLHAFLDPLHPADAQLDEDGDGFDNLSEYHALSDADSATEDPTSSAFYKVFAADGAPGDNLGYSVAVDGDTALLGAHGDDDEGGNSGSAYIYKQDASGNWIQQAKLTATDGDVDDKFGSSVSLSGDTALVGAYANDDNGRDAGSAYVFIRDGAGNWTQQAKLTASDGARYDLFGYSVDLDGDTALVGAHGDDDHGNYSGSSYVFKRDATGNWGQQAKLTASDGAPWDYFGSSVSLSGDTALVGAHQDDDKGSEAGSAYVFKRDAAGNWAQQAKLTAADGEASDWFGRSVSLSGDTALVGASRDDNNYYDAGSAYVFKRDGVGSWVQQAKLTVADGYSEDYFGFSVSLSGDTALVGAFRDDNNGSDSGSSYIFENDGSGNWVLQTRLTAADGAGYDYFAYDVAIDGNNALIGAYRDGDGGNESGSVYFVSLVGDGDGDGINNYNDNCPTLANSKQSDNDGDYQGDACDHDDDNDGYSDSDENDNGSSPTDANDRPSDNDSDFISDLNDNCPLNANVENINTDGDTLCDANDPDDDNDGLPDVYENLHAFLNSLDAADAQHDEDADGFDNLSEYQALSDPENVADAPAGSPFYKVFAADGAKDDFLGYSVAIDGDTALLGAYQDDDSGRDSGSVYVFKRDDAGKWIQQAKLTASDGASRDYFGSSVSLSGDTALVGAHQDDDKGNEAGSAYVFKRDGVGNWVQQAKLTAADGASGDRFGQSVSINGDTALIGAYQDGDNGSGSGSAYVFKRDGAGNWAQQVKLIAADGAAGDYFGSSVSLSDDIAVVGAYRNDSYQYDSGAAYVFKRYGANWVEHTKLVAVDGAREDYFGYSVATDENIVLVGAYQNYDNGSSSGSAYVFKDDGTGNWVQESKLTALDGDTGDKFAYSVSLSGDTAMVGAYEDDDKGYRSGSVYLFQHDGAGNWVQRHKLIAADGERSDQFGIGLAVSAYYAVLGAPGDDDAGFDSGSAYFISLDDDGDGDGFVYVIDNCPLVANVDQANIDNDGLGDVCDSDNDNDGYSDSDENDNATSPLDVDDVPPDNDGDNISDLNDPDDDNDGVLDDGDDCPFDPHAANINSDGDALCDANDPDDDNDGLPDVYENLYTFLDPLNAADASGDEDGDGYDNLSEYHAVTDPGNAAEDPGASAIYKVVTSDGGWADSFGYTVAIDGDAALMIAIGDDDGGVNSGAVYFYQRNGAGEWIQDAKLVVPDVEATDEFGRSVALSGDTALVSSNGDDDKGLNAGAAYIFQRDGAGAWKLQAKLTIADGVKGGGFGESVSLSGANALIGADWSGVDGSYAGAAYIFQRDEAGNWNQQAKLMATGVSNDNGFGKSVSLSGDRALIGALSNDDLGNNTGAAYIFQRDEAGNWHQQAKLLAADGALNRYFGYRVSLSGDTALLTAYQNYGSASELGFVYVFQQDGAGNWNQQAKLMPSNGSPLDRFGFSVSLSGDTALVGAYLDDDNGDGAGAAYVFQRDNAGDWSQVVKLKASDAYRSDTFAYSVSLSGDTALLGAIGDDDNGNQSGSAYFFSFTGDGDNDGINNFRDNCPSISNSDQTDLDGDMLGDACDSDVDGDGVDDGVDNCPLIVNSGQMNADGDVFGDACDSDDDGDGIDDGIDNCPLISNPDQSNLNADTFGDACDSDDDGDGVDDGVDNCPLIANVDQANLDADVFGDVCDSDDDGDGVEDGIDNCPLISNFDQQDADSDGLGDVCDADTDTDSDGVHNDVDYDDDNDGLPDVFELANGLDPFEATDAEADKDNDGYDNLLEFRAGSDLNDINSTPFGLLSTAVLGVAQDKGVRLYDDSVPYGEKGGRELTLGARAPEATLSNYSGEVRGVWCELDGDVGRELVLGLGRGGKGWFEVKDDVATGYRHLAWKQIPWSAYNNSNGETYPACGDVDGDGLDEIVVGLGAGAGGWFYRFEDAVSNYAGGVTGWQRIQWSTYNTSGEGATHPALGDIDGDGRDEVLLGLGSGGSGWIQILDDSQGNFALLKWLRTQWPAYQNSNGAVWPAACDVDGDTKADLVMALGTGAAGWIQILDGASNYTGLSWIRMSAADGTRVACADIDGDGRDELLGGVVGTGRVELLGDKLDNYALGQVINTTAGTPWPMVRGIGPLDSDGDGIADNKDAFPNDPNETKDNDGDDTGDNADTDDDNDGLLDSYELAHGLDPFSASGVNGADGDSDGDGLNNLAEQAAGTSPVLADTDGDGLPDDYEVGVGLDAVDATGAEGAAGDKDGDGYSNEIELHAGTHPNDNSSTPLSLVATAALGVSQNSGVQLYARNAPYAKQGGRGLSLGADAPEAALSNYSGEVRGVWCELDGDVGRELVLGLGSGGKGWFEVKDDVSTGYAHLQWLQIPWAGYNNNNGETYPACGDVDGDGLDEIVVGLGAGAGGWFYRFEDAVSNYTGGVTGWQRVEWPAYNTSGEGATHPALGDMDGDGRAEVVLGLGRGGSGWVALLDDSQGNFALQRWVRLNWLGYNTANGATWPVLCDVQGDGVRDVVLGLGETAAGWLGILNGATAYTTEWTQVSNAAGQAVRVSCADSDGDGRDELLIGVQGSGKVELLGDKLDNYGLGQLINSTAGAPWPMVRGLSTP